MCGILGYTNLDKTILPNECFDALDTLIHRGPDGMGALFLNSRSWAHSLSFEKKKITAKKQFDVFLGHRRLSIIDLSNTAAQPMSNEDASVWITFNGEIYNHRELRNELESLGHVFKSDHSDTEVVVHGWEQWGKKVLDKLNGMFAIGIVDLAKRVVFLARDRFGEKPLYYTQTKDSVSFASELKALIKLGTTTRQISDDAVNAYLGFGYIPAPLTIFYDVKKLEAASCITIMMDEPQNAVPEYYWSLNYDHPDYSSNRNWDEEFLNLLQDSVKSRMESDVPLGVFLSGGLDSTMMLRMMRKLIPGNIDSFTIGFNEKSHDESPYAKIAAERYDATQYVEYLDEKTMLDTIPIIQKHYDEPFADSSTIPTYLVSKLAKKNVTVSLSGDGGDELLAGYHHYRFHYQTGLATTLIPKWAKQQVLNRLIDLWPESVRGKGLIKIAKQQSYPSFLITLWDDYFCKGGLNPLDYIKYPSINKPQYDVNNMCLVGTKTYLPEDIISKVDRASMAVSLESRAPLLNHRLFEMITQMPLSHRFNGIHGKLPFRKLLTKEIGHDFIDRPKKGFSVPIGKWFKNELKEEIHDVLLDHSSLSFKYISSDMAEDLLARHAHGSRDLSSKLWRLYMLNQWYDIYGKQQ